MQHLLKLAGLILFVTFALGSETFQHYYRHPTLPVYEQGEAEKDCIAKNSKEVCYAVGESVNHSCNRYSGCTVTVTPAGKSCYTDIDRRNVNYCMNKKGWYQTEKDGTPKKE
jgi:hypothetical protein